MENWTPEQLQAHLDKGEAVFLKLWKKGCGACKLAIPATERLEQQYGARLVFGQINTDEHPEMLEIADTEVLPFFVLFREKKMLGKHIGFKGLKNLAAWVEGWFLPPDGGG